jgi:dGTPase
MKFSELTPEMIGCLRHLRTEPDAAKRRYDGPSDKDLVFRHLNPFATDADRKISGSKALRRLADKTQVLATPANRHIRTRRSHTDDVVGVATLIAGNLGLNNDLCRGIALGHDIGHTPFGHNGEEFISKVTGKKFRHEVFGTVIAQHVERSGSGLNLTRQVLDGILAHSRGFGALSVNRAVSPEATAVMYADKIAYTTSDYNDLFIRCRIDHPKFKTLHSLMKELGETQRDRVNALVRGLCAESFEKGSVSFSDCPEAVMFGKIRKEFIPVYDASHEDYAPILERVYRFVERTDIGNPALVLALMTDRDVLELDAKRPLSITDLATLSVWELIPDLREKNIDFEDPDLNW